MKYWNRFIRWCKCQHKWKKMSMSDSEVVEIMNYNIKIYETMNPNQERIKICTKCSEVRTFGKVTTVIGGMAHYVPESDRE